MLSMQQIHFNKHLLYSYLSTYQRVLNSGVAFIDPSKTPKLIKLFKERSGPPNFPSKPMALLQQKALLCSPKPQPSSMR